KRRPRAATFVHRIASRLERQTTRLLAPRTSCFGTLFSVPRRRCAPAPCRHRQLHGAHATHKCVAAFRLPQAHHHHSVGVVAAPTHPFRSARLSSAQPHALLHRPGIRSRMRTIHVGRKKSLLH